MINPIKLTIYDYAGRRVKQQILNQQTNTIHLPVLKGVYFLQLYDGSVNIGREKVIVE
jgi:hypothetical protein